SLKLSDAYRPTSFQRSGAPPTGPAVPRPRCDVTNRHWRISDRREVSYDIVLERGLLDSQSRALYRAAALDKPPSERIVVTDETVWAIYGTELAGYLEHHA